MSKLEAVLPKELKKASLFLSGDELVLLLPKPKSAILIATEHQVAVLGVDAFEAQSDGLAQVAT